MHEMPIDEFVAELFKAFEEGRRDIPVGEMLRKNFEKLEVRERFKLLDVMRPRFREMMDRMLAAGEKS